MYPLLCGIVVALSFVAATQFGRSYVRTRDRFFVLFAAAFALLGVTELYLGISNTPELNRPLAYLPRLAVFLLILFAIYDKNRTARKPSAGVADLSAQRKVRSGKRAG